MGALDLFASAPQILCPLHFTLPLDGGVAQQVGGLGSEVLQMVFKLHRVAQQEVLSQLLNRIITGCSSPSVDSYFSEWVGLVFTAQGRGG